MNTSLFGFVGWPEIVGIIVICLILFGAKKVPELMKGLGSGIKEFKKASREVQDEIQKAIDEEPPPPPPRRESSVTPESSASSAAQPAQDRPN